MLKLETVSKHFGGLVAVDQVSFKVLPGEVVGIIGPNGAGKTTLINIISGLEPATSGQIFWNETRITNHPAHELCAQGIARTFQNIRLFPGMTVAENVLTGRHLQTPPASRLFRWLLPGQDRHLAAQKQAVEAELARLNLTEVRTALASELSYGNQRRVELARALATKPRLLLLDEPTAGMNPAETEDLGNLLLQLQREGLTLLVIEHDMNLINQICDRIVVLNFGKHIAAGTPGEIRQNPVVIEAYLGTE